MRSGKQINRVLPVRTELAIVLCTSPLLLWAGLSLALEVLSVVFKPISFELRLLPGLVLRPLHPWLAVSIVAIGVAVVFWRYR